MRCPKHELAAAYQTRFLLAENVPKPHGGDYLYHRVRAGHIAEVIWRRWQVGPGQWELKHVHWYLLEKTDHYASGTRYRHWLTVRLLILCLGHAGDWLDHLDGPWVRPNGKPGPIKDGRPMLEPDYRRSFE
jgi:hypothetical protein